MKGKNFILLGVALLAFLFTNFSRDDVLYAEEDNWDYGLTLIGNGLVEATAWTSTDVDPAIVTAAVELWRDGHLMDSDYDSDNTYAEAYVYDINPPGLQMWDAYGTHTFIDEHHILETEYTHKAKRF